MTVSVEVTPGGQLVVTENGHTWPPLTIEAVQAAYDRITDARNAVAKLLLLANGAALEAVLASRPSTMTAALTVTSTAIAAVVDAATFAACAAQLGVAPVSGVITFGPVTITEAGTPTAYIVQSAGHAALAGSVSVGAGQGWAAPTAGNLLVAVSNADLLIDVLAGWTAADGYLAGMDYRVYYKTADGSESTITVSPSSSANITLVCVELDSAYVAAFDSISLVSAVLNADPLVLSQAVSAAPLSGTNGDLVLALVATHGNGGSAAPTGPEFSNDFDLLQAVTASPGGGSHCCSLFVAAKITAPGVTDTGASVCSWNNVTPDAAAYHLAFTLV